MPVGTFTANVLGSALLAAFHVLQSLGSPLSPNACSLLQGLSDGFCGCLTTVSTFAAETRELGKWKACRYAVISLVAGQVAMVVILGSAIWTGAAGKETTCIYYQSSNKSYAF